MEAIKSIQIRVQEILQQFNIPDFINLNFEEKENEQIFINKLQNHLKERKQSGFSVDLDFVVSIISELSSYKDRKTNVPIGTEDILINGLIECIPICTITGKSLCKLFNQLRNGVKTIKSSEEMRNNIEVLPVALHHRILNAMNEYIRYSDPPHILLPGDKESYLQVSAIPLPASRAYTMSMWVKLNDQMSTKGFLLYRYRSSSSGVDAIISACNQDAGPCTWNLTLRSSCEKKGQRDEVQCRLSITPGEWHMITVKQTAMKDQNADSVSITIDGISILEAELLYPFNNSVNESIWIFGLGMKGLLANITLYPMDLHSSIISLLYSFGPHVANLTVGARCPQSSFDTGHLILGSICAKGSLASKLCQYTPVFCITAVKLTSDARIPLITPGYLYSDHIDLQPRSTEHDDPLFCTLTGGCQVCSLASGIDVWQDAGGCSVIMYLFWSYCDVKHATTNTLLGKPIEATATVDTTLDIVQRGLSATLTLLARLISSSTDFKEQFIQCHGFHVMGFCLSMLTENVKKKIINEEFIDKCFSVVQALGPDAERGDGISAAMQGLLFDFRVWGAIDLSALKHCLQRLSSQLLEIGSLVYKCIGMQRILDIFRLHIARKLSNALINTPNQTSLLLSSEQQQQGKKQHTTENTIEETVMECADCMHRLLIITMDAAQAFAVRNKGSITSDVEALLKCLEETGSVIIAERILRILGNLRLSAPHSLKISLRSVRYTDTAIIPLLTKKGLSQEVRSAALINLLWMWNEDTRSIPGQIIPLRKTLNQILLQQPGTVGHTHHRKSVTTADNIRSKIIVDQINEFVRPLEKGWVNLSMAAEMIKTAMADGQWGSLPPSVFAATTATNSTIVANTDLLEYIAPHTLPNPVVASTTTTTSQVATDVSALIRIITHSGQFDTWMQLPLLPALLSRSDLNTCCTVLMSMNVMFKTDDNQSEVLSSLPTSAWLKMFLSLAMMGEHAAINCESVVSSDASSTVQSESDISVAATCTELALDCVSIVLEYKTRTQMQETRTIWNIFQNVIRNSCIGAFGQSSKLTDIIEMSFLRRIVSLLLHRIANNGEQWTPNAVVRVIHIFAMVESRKLFGNCTAVVSLSGSTNALNTSKPVSTGAAHTNTTVDLLGLDLEDRLDTDLTPTSEVEQLRLQNKSIQETNVICFIFDISSSLRKAADRGYLHGLEWQALKIALRITLSVIEIATDRVADRIMQEILAQLKYMSERWAPITGNGFKSMLMVILTTLKDAINHPMTPENLRSRYTALVFGIMHFFIDMRHNAANGSILSEQILPSLDALMGIDSCNDIALIFKLLEVTMRRADAISFEEVEINVEDSESSRGDQASATSESYISLNKEQFTPDDDRLVKISNDTEDHAEYNDLPSTAEDQQQQTVDPLISLTDDSFPVVIPTGSSGQSPANMPQQQLSAPTSTPSVRSTSPLSPPLTSPVVGAHHAVPAIDAAAATTTRDERFQQWVKVRQGISTERVDCERARLARSMDTLDLTSDATKKFWKKARRKVESESFLQSHTCQWKLGVAHEGPFYGRRRVVLRPRYDSHYGHVVDNSKPIEPELAAAPAASITGLNSSTDQLNRALAKACAGYIKDVTRSEAADTAVTDEKDPAGNSSKGRLDSVTGQQIPGSGWGLVDIDGSEEGGFGVVGIAVAEASPQNVNDEGGVGGSVSTTEEEHSSELPYPHHQIDDMQGDVRQLEENLKQGKSTETGPCHSGTRRVGSGPALLDTKVILITASGNFHGSLSFNGKEIFFASTFEVEDDHKDDSAAVNLVKQRRMRRRRWVLSSVSGIYMRRFRLRDSAMEVFFKKGKHRNFFVDFGHTKENARLRNEFARALMTAAPSTAFKQVPTMSSQRLVYEHKIQEKWLEGKLSNFDYLMALNTLAGRSYNDLCQYPVMPWVLSDYTSSSIDLTDHSIYRDLSKPMGALNPTRLKEFLDRFETFEENVSTGIPAFMYGSHYSTMVGVVLHFLVRLQPFAALHKEMQNGHFDVPDRLFSSIPRSFRHNTTQLSEVKELIPEWYTTPDMFRNVNRFPLGQTQDGDVVDDVELPPWASTPEEFVRINRAALESDYVSNHLHEWIDLIFGYKQRGPDAVEAHNVFYYLTYYGSVNHYMIKDEALRRATELQIAHFGQTPMQLFRVPHPAKKMSSTQSNAGVPRPLRKCFSSTIPTATADPTPTASELPGLTESAPAAWMTAPVPLPLTPSSTETRLVPRNDCDEEVLACQSPCTLVNLASSQRILKAEVFVDRLVCVLENGVVEVLKYGTSDAAKAALAYSASISRSRQRNTRGSMVASGTAKSSSQESGSTKSSGGGDLIILDELYDPFAEMQREQELLEARSMGITGGDVEITPARLLLQRNECLVSLERECTHFEVIPRVPLMKPFLQKSWDAAFTRLRWSRHFQSTPAEMMSSSPTEQSVASIIFTRSCNLLITAGHVDGRVAVREIDSRSGFVKAAADFTAHRRRVVSISTDSIPQSARTDVMATCDEAGIIMVWTILRSLNPQQPTANGYVVSRRPQRLFRCDPQPDMFCEISWQLGVVTVVSGQRVNVYSIERDELIRSFYLETKVISNPVETQKKCDHVSADFLDTVEPKDLLSAKVINVASSTGPEEGPCHISNHKWNGVTRQIALSDFAVVVVHVELFSVDGLQDASAVTRTHAVIAMTLSGQSCGYKQCHAPVTFMNCPDRNEYLVLGYADGTVEICCAVSLLLMHRFQPHSFALNCPLINVTKDGTIRADSAAGKEAQQYRRRSAIPMETTSTAGSGAAKGQMSSEAMATAAEPSPVLSVSIGPNKAMPTVIVVMTESGRIYVQALPDFVRWERVRMPTALQQLASVPLQAVKGTLMHAQNWTTETAGVLAQNARSLADDALLQLRTMKKSNLAKGMASLFGLGGGKNTSNGGSGSGDMK